jgi:outer membrane protein OmpA-like peptidoglycan-associated protein
MKKTVMIILVMIQVLCTNAQEGFVTVNQAKKNEPAIKTTFMATRIPENWFFSLGGGVGDLMSEESRYVPFTERVRPMVAVSVGKWLSPVWGIRLNMTGSTLQGFATWNYNPEDPFNVDHGLSGWYVGANHNLPGQMGTNDYVTVYNNVTNAAYIRQAYLDRERNTDKGPGYEYDLTYAGASLDFLLNVNNVFRPYRGDRFFEMVLIAGAAYAHTFKDGPRAVDLRGYGNASGGVYDETNGGLIDVSRTAVNTVGLKLGIQAKFRVALKWDLFAEAHTYILPEMLDRRAGDGNTMDGIGNYMLGVTYAFGKSYFEEPDVVDVAMIERLNRKINELQSRPPVVVQDNCCEEIKARLAELERLLKERPKEVSKEKLKVIVHFLIDKHNVRPSEMYKLEEIASFMVKYPQVRVSVSGYADVKTAYPEYNMKLSDRRAREVVRILTDKFSISKNRFEIKAYGDTVQPFDVNELNRAVIAFDID